MSLSEDLRNELAGIVPRQGVRPARRALGSRAHRGQPAPPWTRRDRAPPRPREPRCGAARLQPPARARPHVRDPHLSATCLRAGDAVPAPCRRRRPGAGRAARGGRGQPRSRAARAAAAAGGGSRVLPRGVPARGASRQRHALGPALAPSGGAQRHARGCRVRGLRGRAARRAAECARARPARGRLRQGAGADRDALAAAGASDAVLAFEEQSVMGATKARANRLANADHANLVRTSRAAQAQIRAVKRLERRGRWRSCRRSFVR